MGLQSYSSHDSGASIIKYSEDGKILDYIAISEERLIRKKYPYVFPVHSIAYCMEHFGLTSMDQVDLLMVDHIRLKRWFNSGPTYNISDFDYLKLKFDIDPKKIFIIGHHLAHAASTYYASGFKDSAILIVDGNGSDLETTSYFQGSTSGIELMDNYKYHGVGACYSAVTSHILNFGTGGEGKTMGLAPYGEQHTKNILNIQGDLDGVRNNFSSFIRRMPYSDVLNHLNPPQRIYPLKKKYQKCEDAKDLLGPYFSRVAYEIQAETERVLVHLARDLYRETKSPNVCIAGGVGLNSVSNKIVLDKTKFKNIYIFPACADAGIPFGLALWGYYNHSSTSHFKKKKLKFKNAYTGIEYSDEHTTKVFRKYKLPYTQIKPKQAAHYIDQGKIVGWFQGGSEYGPRALGHRSILADSRQADMKDIINSRVKHRESFRPFAPAILKEHSQEYFHLKPDSPYMLLVAKVKKPKAIPSVTHVDNTARVQTVTKKDNDAYYDVIKEFYKITGVPCILNTSFNNAGEPIVETPEDAIICFLKNKIDYLVIGNYLLDAQEIKNKRGIIKVMEKNRLSNIQKKRSQILKQYFKGYNEQERDKFIKESNEISKWHVQYKCKYELEKQVMRWLDNKKNILIIGDKKHTDILPKYINGFNLLKIAAFCEYDPKTRTIQDFGDLDYDEILISSHEDNFEILELLKKQEINKPIYAIYDNTSRSFADVLTSWPTYKYE